jgi:two-component sensor histidine kinase
MDFTSASPRPFQDDRAEPRARGGLFTRLRQAGLILGLWTFLGVLMSLQDHHCATLAGRPISWGRTFASEFTYAYLWAAMTPAALWLGRRYPLSRAAWLWRSLVHLAAAVCLSLLVKAIWDLLFVAPEKRFTALGFVIDYGIMQYALVLLSQHLWHSHRRSVQLEAQLSQAQLAALRMQLHPHFLFNTLHAISELIHQNPGAAERMIVRLSDFLRLTLDQSTAAEVSLRQELDFLKRYLEIERVRFEERLQVDFQVDPAALDAAVPNFLLQPLVENALRHGLANRLQDGMLRIECRLAAGKLAMKVADNGSGTDSLQVRPGLGLGITQQRLQRLYGEDHRLELRRAASGGCEVEIEIPWRRYAP